MKYPNVFISSFLYLFCVTLTWTAHALNSAEEEFSPGAPKRSNASHKRKLGDDSTPLVTSESCKKGTIPPRKKRKANAQPLSLMMLPDEVKAMICSYLPKESLLEMRLVCRSLGNVASDPKLYYHFFPKRWDHHQQWFALPPAKSFQGFLADTMMFSTMRDLLTGSFDLPQMPTSQRFFKCIGRLAILRNNLQQGETEKKEALNFMTQMLLDCFYYKANIPFISQPVSVPNFLDLNTPGSNIRERELYEVALEMMRQSEDILFVNYCPGCPSLLERHYRTYDYRTKLMEVPMEPHKLSLCEKLLEFSIYPESNTMDLCIVADTYFNQHQFKRAAAVYDEMVKRDPNTSERRYVSAGTAHFEAHNTPRAAELFEEALRRDPNLPAFVYTDAGIAHFENQNYARAAELYKLALTKDPHLSNEEIINGGTAHLLSGHFQRAKKLLLKPLSEKEKGILSPLLEGDDQYAILQRVDNYRANAGNSLDIRSSLARAVYTLCYSYHWALGNKVLAEEIKETFYQFNRY